MPGTVETPIDLTLDSDDDRRMPLRTRPEGDTGGRSSLTMQSPHQTRPDGIPSKPVMAGASSASPGSASLSHLQRRDASPRSGLLAASADPSTMPLPVSRDLAAANTTPRRPAKPEVTYDLDKVISQLKSCAAEMKRTNAEIVKDVLETIVQEPVEHRHLSAVDHFADLPAIAEEPASASKEAFQIRFRLFVGSDKAPRQRKQAFTPLVLKPTKERVPKYRFHHVEIARNILTPSTNLRFVPFTRDVKNAAEEASFYNWLESLRGMDQTDGMDTLALEDSHLRNNKKAQFMARQEYAATLHPYLERWITRLGLAHLDRPALIHYMASETADDDSSITPKQKSTLLGSHSGTGNSPDAHAAAKAFTEAFDSVFGRRATLREVLMLDETVEDLLQRSKTSKETGNSQNLRDEEILRELEEAVATNNLFNCLICFSNGCDHGSINVDSNTQSRLSIANVLVKMAPMVKKRWIEQSKTGPQMSQVAVPVKLCKNQCFQGSHPTAPAPPEWSAKEVLFLKTMFVAQAKSTVRPECSMAVMMGRKCWDIRDKLMALNLSLPYTPPPPEKPWAKNVSWYDRIRKHFIGSDWQEHTITSEFQNRDLTEPCQHEGACTAANGCPCVYGKILCDRFCQCSADSCPYKFTGCACHSSGKTCLERVRKGENPCICMLLGRECDPMLCLDCGAAERADPLNKYDWALHATGCQNVPMQRGVAKAVCLGASQLEGCGYGLFTAEDIAQDDFVIEYTGELIKSDEGVRREARRGNVFDQSKNTSYLFTLLETEQVWVDAAVYGNLSRYINHAGDHDKKGANLTPKIVYVQGEYRIRFSAMRDIRRGEELFFNYGDNFPNLTKKLLEDKDVAGGRRKPGPKPNPNKPGRKPGRPPSKMVKTKSNDAEPASKRGGRLSTRGRATKKAPASRHPDPDEMDIDEEEEPEEEEEEEEDDDAAEEEEPFVSTYFSPSGRSRRHRIPPPPDDDDDYDEYRPGHQTDSHEDNEAFTLARARARRRAADQHQPRGTPLLGTPQKGVHRTGTSTTTTPQKGTPTKGGGGAQQGGGKPVSKRGGARPGAGRKPKNPKPTTLTPTSAPAESEAEDEIEDSDVAASDDGDESTEEVETGRGYSLRTRRRKRKSPEEEDEEDEEESGLFGDDGRGDVSELGAASASSSNKESTVGSEDVDDVIDRSRRKRQKPARYRGDDE